MNSQIQLSQDIVNAIQKKYMILIVGGQGSGKTTESAAITGALNKQGNVIVQHSGHQADEILHKTFNIRRIIAGQDQIKKEIQKLRGCILIYDDFKSANPRQQKNIHEISYDLRKRDLILILNYHGRKIPTDYMDNSHNFLIVKSGARLTRNKFGQYFDLKGISLRAEEFCSNIKDKDSVYIKKNGVYYHRDGITNIITENKFEPKGSAAIDIKKLKRSALTGKTHEKLAKKFNCSVSTIYQKLKTLQQQDPKFAEAYSNSKKKKVASKKPKIAKKQQSGIHLSVYQEKYISLQNKNVRKIAQINNLSDIGSVAASVVGEGIYNAFIEAGKKGLVQNARITVIETGTGGADVTIENYDKQKQIEIEVKNYKQTPQRKFITKSTILRDVIGTKKPRFSAAATEKWLFTCGMGVERKAKKILKQNNINYKRLSYEQLKEKGNSDRKYHIKKIMKQYVDTKWI
ncbi:MAG: hypothetical protein MUO82_01930 [Candidatus Thermoplasmatota archaeon]|nr:hypothetical protein [Candidatus Thermoplasmatota archaeon]